MKLSQHAKVRMKQRTNLNHQERRILFRQALDKGKSPNDIKNKKLKEYLESKSKCKVKLYKGYVFIYSKTTTKLYTMYPIPQELLEEGE